MLRVESSAHPSTARGFQDITACISAHTHAPPHQCLQPHALRLGCQLRRVLPRLQVRPLPTQLLGQLPAERDAALCSLLHNLATNRQGRPVPAGMQAPHLSCACMRACSASRPSRCLSLSRSCASPWARRASRSATARATSRARPSSADRINSDMLRGRMSVGCCLPLQGKWQAPNPPCPLPRTCPPSPPCLPVTVPPAAAAPAPAMPPQLPAAPLPAPRGDGAAETPPPPCMGHTHGTALRVKPTLITLSCLASALPPRTSPAPPLPSPSPAGRRAPSRLPHAGTRPPPPPAAAPRPPPAAPRPPPPGPATAACGGQSPARCRREGCGGTRARAPQRRTPPRAPPRLSPGVLRLAPHRLHARLGRRAQPPRRLRLPPRPRQRRLARRQLAPQPRHLPGWRQMRLVRWASGVGPAWLPPRPRACAGHGRRRGGGGRSGGWCDGIRDGGSACGGSCRAVHHRNTPTPSPPLSSPPHLSPRRPSPPPQVSSPAAAAPRGRLGGQWTRPGQPRRCVAAIVPRRGRGGPWGQGRLGVHPRRGARGCPGLSRGCRRLQKEERTTVKQIRHARHAGIPSRMALFSPDASPLSTGVADRPTPGPEVAPGARVPRGGESSPAPGRSRPCPQLSSAAGGAEGGERGSGCRLRGQKGVGVDAPSRGLSASRTASRAEPRCESQHYPRAVT